MSGGVHSGRYGVVNGLTAIRNWTINDNGQLAAFINSATAIGTGRKPGITSWAGTYANHGAVPPVMPGVLFGFAGYTAPDDDVLSHTGDKYSGNAMVESVAINWDWASGAVLENQTAFSGALGLTYNTASSYPYADTGVSDPEPVAPCHIDYSADGVTWTTLNNLTQATLQLVNSVQPVVNSSTAGGTDRRAGKFDWSASISIQDSLLGGGLTKFASYQWRFYTTATLFYLLKWGTVKEYTGLQVNPETGAIIAHTVSIEMNAEVGGVLGTVKTPGAVAYWN